MFAVSALCVCGHTSIEGSRWQGFDRRWMDVRTRETPTKTQKETLP